MRLMRNVKYVIIVGNANEYGYQVWRKNKSDLKGVRQDLLNFSKNQKKYLLSVMQNLTLPTSLTSNQQPALFFLALEKTLVLLGEVCLINRSLEYIYTLVGSSHIIGLMSQRLIDWPLWPASKLTRLKSLRRVTRITQADWLIHASC